MAAFAILALCLALATFSGGLCSPAWNNMIVKVIPLERRGFFFGFSHALGGLLGIMGAVFSRHVLQSYPYPTSFGISFLLCFVFQVCSWIGLSLNREPARPPTQAAPSSREYWRRLPSVLRANPNFCRYLASRTLIILGGMATSFYVVYAHRAFAVDDAFAANLTVAALVSQTALTPLLGWLADRRGNKWLTELSTLIGAAAVLLAMAAPSAIWLYGVFLLMNAALSGLIVAGLGITLEFSGHDQVPTFTALAHTLLAGPILLAPVLGGWLVDVAGFSLLFLVALVLYAFGYITMRWGVREPRYERPAQGEPVG